MDEINLKQPVSESLNGSVERVTFHNDESGFCVLRVKVRGHSDLVTVVGNTPTISEGEYIESSGRWVNNRTYGLQFSAESLCTIPPTTREGMEKYLASGMIHGIGSHFAKKLVTAFGESIFDVIENDANRLLEVEGIGKKRLEHILKAWSAQKVTREIMVFLHSHGVGTARAVRIYKCYGADAIQKVQENPYRLALDIQGIGFKTADLIAQQLGVAKDSLLRAQAGVRFALQELSGEGHCASLRESLVETTEKLLDIPASVIEEAINAELREKRLIAEWINEQTCIFLAPLYYAEQGIARHLQRLLAGSPPWSNINLTKMLAWVEAEIHCALSPSQRQALMLAIRSKVVVITGGPGVGKTTLVNSLLKILHAEKLRVSLCAPTGRAAKRLSESTGLDAKTIHRLLEYSGEIRGFKRTAENPLDTDLVVIDETSMVDVVLMNQLLRAIPSLAGLVIVGDVDQIASVGPGTVLADIINSGVIPTVRLTEIFRQAATSKIITNAHRVNQGWLPESGEKSVSTTASVQETRTPYHKVVPLSDFYLISVTDPEQIMAKLLYVITERIPARFGFDPIRDIQVLTPMQRGGLGVRALNVELQRYLNPNAEPTLTRFGSTFALGDKIIQTVNNYDLDVFNGDIGTIVNIDLTGNKAVVDFDGHEVTYTSDDLDEVSLAYATTIHKAQGSEFEAVVIPLALQHYLLLQRNLLYTAITRARKLLVIICQPKALAIAVNNNHAMKRLTHLTAKLQAVESL